MFNKAIAGTGVPKYLSSDNDPLFTCHRGPATLRILEIDELKTVPCTPISHPFVERPIGSLRRQLLDQVFFWNAVDLERKLRSFQLYFKHSRTHASLDGNTPAEMSANVVTHPAAAAQFHLGKALRVAYSNSRSPREYEFATDRSAPVKVKDGDVDTALEN